MTDSNTNSQDSRVAHFAIEANKDIIKDFLRRLPSIPTSGTLDFKEHLETILQWILASPAEFDENCQVNIKWIGNSLIQRMMSGEQNEAQVPEIFILAYRFLLEFEFYKGIEASIEVQNIQNFVAQNMPSFPERTKRQIAYAHYTMPAQIAKHLLHHPKVTDARKLFEGIDKAEGFKKGWDEDIQAKTAELNGLRTELKHLTSEFNFVGLVDGFKKLRSTKVWEKRFAFCSLLFLALCMLAPPIFELAFVNEHTPAQIEKYQGALLYTLPALITVEVLLVYLFRVVLSHFRSVKAQLLQLDLRVALCQFIQSYAEYAEKLKKQSQTSLEKFESLIFSGLMANEESLPSTFDGTEQLTKLLQAARGK